MIEYKFGGDSGFGFHYWSAFGSCPRKATLNNTAGYGEHRNSDGTTEGSIGHAFADLYYQGIEFEPEDVHFGRPIPAELRDNMCRVWNEYRGKFPRDEFGEILSIEELIHGPEVSQALGVDPYTMKADLVCHLESDEQCSVLRSLRPGLVDIVPGRYGVDHKFLKRRNSNQEFKYPNSLQFVGYQLGWNAKYPDKALDGWIANIVIKTKDVQYYSYLIPPPSEVEVKALRTALQYWKFVRDNLPNQTNPLEDYCFGYTDPCWWFKNGECDRGAVGDELVQLGTKLAA